MSEHGFALANVRYRVGDAALLDIRKLDLGSTGTTAIMGPNGAGKSLLLRLMHGLVSPTDGTISIYGAPLSAEHRRAQALVFQKPVLLRRSAAANISFVLKARGLDVSKVDPLLTRVGLAEKAMTPARRLSGGEQQRLALARALATEPDVLFLDEPTASLDPTSAKAIEDIVRSAVKDGVRVILVTHDAAQASRLADDIVFLHRGNVIEHGTAEDFIAGPKTKLASAYLSGKLDDLVET